MTAFTPGPWAADAISESGDIRIGCVDLPLVIASVHNGAAIGEILFGNPPVTQWANAHLIAAAPDLLAALKALMAFDSRAYVKQSELARDLLAAKKIGWAAIAKATP